MTTVDRIFELMKQYNLSAKEFANKVGISQGNVTDWKTGRAKPSVSSLAKIANCFGISVDYLLGNTNKIIDDNSSFEAIKRYYEEKAGILLENKYVDKLLKLDLTDFEIQTLMRIITSDDSQVTKNYSSLLNTVFYILSLNHDETIIEKVKNLVSEYNREKFHIINEELSICKKKKEKDENKLKESHIDKLHSSISGKDSTSLEENVESLLDYMDKNGLNNLHMCPVYGQISAGQPNWAEECLEGYLPIDPNLMGIINPEQCFFLRVKGESMNQLIKNGAYALIRKQDVVENGEVAVVLVNGDEATLKKFTQHGDVIVLEPMSDDPNFKTQIYDKNTRIQILGKYIGKFEMKK